MYRGALAKNGLPVQAPKPLDYTQLNQDVAIHHCGDCHHVDGQCR